MIAVIIAALIARQPLPDIASRLPATWPPPGWPTVPTLPAAAGIAPAAKDAPADAWVTVFPHVRVNRAVRGVEFDGVVAWDFHNPDTPRTELELLVCLPNRDKEHESLVQSRALGAHVHAALLMAGLEPGAPGRLDFGGEKVARIPPTGPRVSVTFRYTREGRAAADDAMSWVKDEGRPPVSTDLVFSGSRIGKRANSQVSTYDADELGCLIGLCTFGGETIALTTVVSPDSGLDAPRFIGNNAAIPPGDTAVQVRITPAAVAPPAASSAPPGVR